MKIITLWAHHYFGLRKKYIKKRVEEREGGVGVVLGAPFKGKEGKAGQGGPLHRTVQTL